jgi:hypothetical protein
MPEPNNNSRTTAGVLLVAAWVALVVGSGVGWYLGRIVLGCP